MAKEIDFNSALYIAVSLGGWKQITDKHEVTCWTSGDWDDYYFVFECRPGEKDAMRMEFIALGDKTYLNLFKPKETTPSGKVIWAADARSSKEKIDIDTLCAKLTQASIYVVDRSVYSNVK